MARLYARRKLTFHSDKLPALAGLARAFQHKFQTRYIAGLWETTLLEDLLWSYDTYNSEAKVALKDVQHAPSWSWLSVEGEVDYQFWEYNSRGVTTRRAGHTFIAEFVECDLKLAGPDEFGQLESWSLHLRGLVKSKQLFSRGGQ